MTPLVPPAVPAPVAGRVVRRWRRRFGAYVALTKPRIIELLLVTTLPTMMVADRRVPPVGLMAATMLGGAMAAAGANATNMYLDRDIDAVMGRTRHRPIVTGQVAPAAALAFAAALEATAFIELWLAVNLLSAALALAAAAFYLGVYTLWLKRRVASNIVIGGAAGAVPVLVGWSAVTDRLSVTALVLFAIVVLWTPPHFWALAVRFRDDYAAADVPMLPAVSGLASTARRILAYSALVTAVGVALGPIAHLGWVYTAPAAVLGAGLLRRAEGFRRTLAPADAMRLFHTSITYLALLFTAMAAAVLAAGRW